MKTSRFVLLLLGLAAGVACADDVQIYVLSNHADLISGGDALVEIAIPAGADASSMRVTLGDHDVTAVFAVRADGRYFGRIEGLALGANIVTAQLPDGRGARITITNHPSSGPVFSGPQVQPWSCNPGASDASCTRAPSYQYFYVPAGIDPQTTPGVIGGPPGPDAYFQTYDPANPPPAAAIARTTTDQGYTVPFIVRLETGSVDRGQYQIAVLFGEFERTIIQERVKAGLARARAKGKTLGRPKTNAKIEQQIRNLAAKGVGKVKIARMLGIGASVTQRVLA